MYVRVAEGVNAVWAVKKLLLAWIGLHVFPTRLGPAAGHELQVVVSIDVIVGEGGAALSGVPGLRVVRGLALSDVHGLLEILDLLGETFLLRFHYFISK